MLPLAKSGKQGLKLYMDFTELENPSLFTAFLQIGLEVCIYILLLLIYAERTAVLFLRFCCSFRLY